MEGGKVPGRETARAKPLRRVGAGAAEIQKEGQWVRRWRARASDWEGSIGSRRILKGAPRSKKCYSQCTKEGLAGF